MLDELLEETTRKVRLNELVKQYTYLAVIAAKQIHITRNYKDYHNALSAATEAIWRGLMRYDKERGLNLESFLYYCAYRACTALAYWESKRKNKLKQFHISDDGEDSSQQIEAPDRDFLERQRLASELLDSVLHKLQPKQAEVVRMVYIENIPQREVAASLGISAQAVGHRLGRAYRDMRHFCRVGHLKERVEDIFGPGASLDRID